MLVLACSAPCALLLEQPTHSSFCFFFTASRYSDYEINSTRVHTKAASPLPPFPTKLDSSRQPMSNNHARFQAHQRDAKNGRSSLSLRVWRQCDPSLNGVSHVFVDEIHERDLNTDFLLIILRRLLRTRKDLKCVLMSATLNAELFAEYFDKCPVMEIPGRAFPVTTLFLEDAIEHRCSHQRHCCGN